MVRFFLAACLETTVSAAQIKIPVRLEIKEPVVLCSAHCAGAGPKRCLVVCCDRQCIEPALPQEETKHATDFTEVL